MKSAKHFKNSLFNLSPLSFEEFALELFRFQANHNEIYNVYIKNLKINIDEVQSLTAIPFLPIDFFKTQSVKTQHWEPSHIFKSSGTTNDYRSQHFIRDLDFYHQVSFKIFEDFFKPIENLKIFALLPSYIEQGDSSLIEMINYIMKNVNTGSKFLLNDFDELQSEIENSAQKVMLFGVSYALLDLAENRSIDLSNQLVVDTGGMKGRKKEITRNELHEKLKSAFSINSIHSEYGMTELFSQAYGQDGLLSFPKWCKPLVRDLNDPFYITKNGSGALNIIDLANIDSCAFVETKDLIMLSENGVFEVLGRMDNSDIRGCSLLL